MKNIFCVFSVATWIACWAAAAGCPDLRGEYDCTPSGNPPTFGIIFPAVAVTETKVPDGVRLKVEISSVFGGSHQFDILADDQTHSSAPIHASDYDLSDVRTTGWCSVGFFRGIFSNKESGKLLKDGQEVGSFNRTTSYYLTWGGSLRISQNGQAVTPEGKVPLQSETTCRRLY